MFGDKESVFYTFEESFLFLISTDLQVNKLMNNHIDGLPFHLCTLLRGSFL